MGTSSLGISWSVRLGLSQLLVPSLLSKVSWDDFLFGMVMLDGCVKCVGIASIGVDLRGSKALRSEVREGGG